MAIIVPNDFYIFTSNASVPGSPNQWAWVGLAATAGASACAAWYATTASTAGCVLMNITLPAGETRIYGPVNAPCGLYVANVSGGSAIAWIKQ